MPHIHRSLLVICHPGLAAKISTMKQAIAMEPSMNQGRYLPHRLLVRSASEPMTGSLNASKILTTSIMTDTVAAGIPIVSV